MVLELTLLCEVRMILNVRIEQESAKTCYQVVVPNPLDACQKQWNAGFDTHEIVPQT